METIISSPANVTFATKILCNLEEKEALLTRTETKKHYPDAKITGNKLWKAP